MTVVSWLGPQLSTAYLRCNALPAAFLRPTDPAFPTFPYGCYKVPLCAIIDTQVEQSFLTARIAPVERTLRPMFWEGFLNGQQWLLPPAVAGGTGTLLANTSVSPAITAIFGLLLIGLIACLALEEKLHAKKSLIAGIFAILVLGLGTATGVLDFSAVLVGSHRVALEQPVQLEVYDADGQHHHPVEVVPENHTDNHEEVTAESERSTTSQSATTATGEPTDQHPSSTDEELHYGGESIAMPVYIPGIDWAVIAIILGSSLFVDVTSKSGLFSWIAIRVTKLSRGDPVRLLFLYGIMTVIFSAVLNNVTAMIIVGSLTVVSLDRLGRRNYLLAFLMTEGLLTNIGGLLTLISSVPNILVGTAAGISFTTFFLKSAPYVIAATAGTLYMAVWYFRITPLTSEKDLHHAEELVGSMDENDGIASLGFFWFSASALICFILLIALTSAIPGIRELGMGYVAMLFAAIMLWRFKSEVHQFYQAVDWDLLGFFMALFVVIYVMEHANVLGAIGSGIQMVLSDVEDQVGAKSDASILIVGAAGFSSVTDNIPLAAMLAKILQQLGAPESSTLWWSVVFGANLGGNLTPIGSASTLVAVTIMHKEKLKVGFMDFVRLAFPFAAFQIVAAILYVLLILPLFH